VTNQRRLANILRWCGAVRFRARRYPTKPFSRSDDASLKLRSSINDQAEIEILFLEIRNGCHRKVLSPTLPNCGVDVEILKTIGMFCGAGLTIHMLVESYGLDLSPGFF